MWQTKYNAAATSELNSTPKTFQVEEITLQQD